MLFFVVAWCFKNTKQSCALCGNLAWINGTSWNYGQTITW